METGKKRNAEATAERILHVAQEVFHERGYDGATTREIAERAGVNVALIQRYFGSKLGLFEKAILTHLSLERFFDQPIETLGERMANTYVDGTPKTRFDPFVVLLRSVSSPEAGPALAETIEKQAIKPLKAALGGKHTEARAILIATQLAGLILQLRILGLHPSTEKERDVIKTRLTDYLNGLIAE